MENYLIARQFSMLSKLMDIHAENSFKSKSYSIAAFNIEKLPEELDGMPREKIFALKGIGESLGKKIIEILDHGHLKMLEEYILKTPPGVLEIMQVKGLGPKKINTIWKEMEIESLGELLHACTENRLARIKGFGIKTQKSVEESIQFILKSKGNRLYAEVEQYCTDMDQFLKKAFPNHLFEISGAFRRQMPVIETLDWITTAAVNELRDFFADKGFEEQESGSAFIYFSGNENVLLRFFSSTKSLFYSKLFENSGSESFLEEWKKHEIGKPDRYTAEESIFTEAGLNYIPPFLRESKIIIAKAKNETFQDLIVPDDIRGIVHSHSTWSDGSNTIQDMAEACISKGLQYLVISDHSKSAFYANGLKEDAIIAQHQEIDELNEKLKPFRIFKSIECDILYDGSLDYPNEILAGFDLVITSIHSNLKMPLEKAMLRLLKAIENPYTTILGHMTSRLLLSRPGYPVDYFTVIDACAKHGVAIELNANPRRLDMDWEYIPYALEKGVMISINPDAHDIAEFDNIKYGVLAAQKAGLKKSQNLSSLSLTDFEAYIK